MSLYNSEYYGIEVDEAEESTKDQSIITIHQNRSGLLSEIKLNYNSLTGDFADKLEKWKERKTTNA